MPFKYKDPKTVISPKPNVKNIIVLHDGGNKPGSYSVAKLKWNGRDVIGVRWNINENEPFDPAKVSGAEDCIGEPNSRGYATWFILPDDLLQTLIKGEKFASLIQGHLTEQKKSNKL